MEVLTDEEGAIALRLARTTLDQVIAKSTASLPALTPIFSQKRGVFVTLTKAGSLRGCIGFPSPILPLGDAIKEAAVAAAQEDPRFPPVSASELPALRIDITVLTVPALLSVAPEERPSAIEVGRHGLIVRGHGTSGLLLPQVPGEYGWDSTAFLDHTCQKAGLPMGCWRKSTVEVLTFEGQIFSEK